MGLVWSSTYEESNAVAETKKMHQEEWQEVMKVYRQLHPSGDQQTHEIVPIVNRLFGTEDILVTHDSQNSNLSATAHEGPAKTHQPSSDEGLADELKNVTFDAVSSTFASGSGEKGPLHEGRGSRAIEEEVFQIGATAHFALDEGLQSGCFDKAGDATEDQGLTVELEGPTVDEVSSSSFVSGSRDGGPLQEGRDSHAMKEELSQSVTTLLSAVEDGLKSGHFDMEGDATGDQDTTDELGVFIKFLKERFRK